MKMELINCMSNWDPVDLSAEECVLEPEGNEDHMKCFKRLWQLRTQSVRRKINTFGRPLKYLAMETACFEL